MVDMSPVVWVGVGAALTLLCAALAWLWWRYRGPGSLRDYVSQEDAPEGSFRIAYKTRTPWQRIAVVEHQGQTLIYGNGYVMFGTTADDDMYAEALIHVPMALAAGRRRVLILGGGGGITTREVLKYPEVKAVTVVDIDATMMHFGKTLAPLVKFNRRSLHDDRVRTVIEDGRAFVEGSTATWDVIVVDLPEPTTDTPALKRLYSREFYSLLADRLEPGGVVVVACSTPSWMPEYFWSIQATMRAAGLAPLPYRFDVFVEYEEDWGYCVAAKEPLSPADVSIPVSTRYLSPERLADMFHIPYGLRQMQGRAKVQTDNNAVLLAMTAD